MLTFSTQPLNNDVLVLGISGDLDTYTAPDFFACIETEIENGHRKIVVDCSHLRYVSSAGVGAMIRTHARMKKHGGDVRLAALTGPVRDIFHITMLDRILGIHDTVAHAAESF